MPIDLFSLPRYTSLIATGIVIGMMWMVYRLPYRAGRVVDVCLAGITGGIVLARVFHVGLHWRYFQDHTVEIIDLRAGGLDWHGAVIGALLAMAVVARVRGVDFRQMLVPLTVVLPLMVIFAWAGCEAAHCAYGAEVENLSEHSPLLVSESRDIYNTIAPRYRTQQIGMALGVVLLLTAVAFRQITVPERRSAVFWVILALLGVGMFGIGAVRGDFAEHIAGLRADRWLDLGVVVLALLMLLRPVQDQSP